MKKQLLIAISLLPCLVSAQKLQKPEVDRISGDTIWSTSKNKIYLNGNYLTQQGEAVESQVTKTRNAVILILIPQTMNEKSNFTISEGQKAYLKFKDNSLVTLTCHLNIASYAQKSYIEDTKLTSGILNVPYVISADDIAKIKSADLTFLRIETSIGNFDCEIKSKFSQVIKKQVELVTNVK